MRCLTLPVLAGAAAAVLAGCAAGPGHHQAPTAPTRTSASPSAPITSAAPRPVAAPVPAVPHDYVPAAGPTRFELTGARFTIRANVCAMKPVFPLDPPGEQRHTVCWVTKGFGVMPGSNTATTYVLGHAWAGDRQEVLNRASSLATKQVLRTPPTRLDGIPIHRVTVLNGYRLVLTTPTGVLTYVVRDAYGVDKLKLGRIRSVLDANVKGRIVLITCATLNGVDYDYDIVANAYLYSSTVR